MDVVSYNRSAWDKQVEEGNEWTVPVGPEIIAAARRGEWSVVLTARKPVPPGWFPPLAGADVLCLASGGGQQGPVLAAAGANVTVFDNSPQQLARDRLVADRDGLAIRHGAGRYARPVALSPARRSIWCSTPSPTCSAPRCAPCGARRIECCDMAACCWPAS